MKVREVIRNWPLKRWARDDSPHGVFPPIEADDLRLHWFSTPDDAGWFRISATDSEHCHWSTFCRVDDLAAWPALERALSRKLRASFEEIGASDVDEG